MPGIYFSYPKFLLALILVPVLIFIYFFSFFYNRKKAVVFPNFEIMQKISGIGVFSKNFVSLYLNIIILCLLIFALAETNVVYSADTSVQAYVIALDSSGSMKAVDMQPNRLEAAKEAGKKFVDLLPAGTEIGVLSFAGNINILQEGDTSKLKSKLAIDSIDFGTVEGTNIYSAIIISNRILSNSESKAVILVSDGQINIGDADQVIKYAIKNNLVVNTFAIGTKEGGLTEFKTVSKTDEQFLEALAFNTGGAYFSVTNVSDFDNSFKKILTQTNREISINISIYLILATIVLFFLNWFIYNFRFRIIP